MLQDFSRCPPPSFVVSQGNKRAGRPSFESSAPGRVRLSAPGRVRLRPSCSTAGSSSAARTSRSIRRRSTSTRGNPPLAQYGGHRRLAPFARGRPESFGEIMKTITFIIAYLWATPLVAIEHRLLSNPSPLVPGSLFRHSDGRRSYAHCLVWLEILLETLGEREKAANVPACSFERGPPSMVLTKLHSLMYVTHYQ